MRILRSIMTGLIFAVFVIVVISFSISFIYEDEVSEIFLEEVNKRLKPELQTGEINLSLLKKFPNATVVINDAQLTSLDSVRDTTFHVSVEALFLQFDVVDIFRKNYSIDHIHAEKCKLQYYLNKNQNIAEKENLEGDFDLNINELKINDLKYIVENESTGLKLQGFSDQAILSGNLTSRTFFMNMEMESRIKSFEANNFRYISNKKISVDTDINVTPEFYSIQKGFFALENIPLAINGKLDRKNNHLALSCQGKNLSVSKLKLYVPWKIQEQINDIIISSGKIDILASIDGKIKDQQPSIEADLKIRKGKFKIERKDEVRFTGVNASMYYTNGIFNQPKSSSLTFNNLSANYKNSDIQGNISISNFKNPELDSKLALSIRLGDIQQWLDSLDVNDANGLVNTKINIASPIKQLNDIRSLIHQKRMTADFTFEKVRFTMPDIFVEKLNGFAYIDRDLYCNSVQFVLNEDNDIKFTGNLKNYYTKTEPLSINGKVLSKSLWPARIFPNKKSEEGQFKIPDSFSADLDVLIEELYYKDISFNSLKGNIIFRPGLVKLNAFNFNTLDGSCKLKGTLKNTNDQNYHLHSHFVLNDMDINKSFKSFNNFGQDYIKASNIKGALNGEFYLDAILDSDFKIMPASLDNVSKFTIQKGELIQFKPLLELSKFISVSELKHVRFSNFSNRITIKDQTVQIPKMDINSSALDLTISGFHKFNGKYRYNMNLLLSEILSRKASPEVDKYGYVEDDGVGNTRLYLLMKGDTANSTIKYDKQGVKDKIRQDLQTEKGNLKRILNEEFGFFSSDTASETKNPGKTQNEDFKIKWEEESKDSAKEQTKDKKSKENKDKKSKFIIEWDEDTLSNKLN